VYEHVFAMAHAFYLREKARSMRIERKLTIDELAERLALCQQRKSNSNRMTGRRWRSRYGVLNVRVHDTLLRARLHAACLDGLLAGRMAVEWPDRGVAKPGIAHRLGR
jgi:hypothetical protein